MSISASVGENRLVGFALELSIPRFIFGIRSRERLGDEVDLLRCKRVLVLSVHGQEKDGKRVARMLGDRTVGLFVEAAMHFPAEGARRACEIASEGGADCVVAIGGGSAIGLGKARCKLRCQS